jgi:uncharacterized protein YecE (DUF72 family)
MTEYYIGCSGFYYQDWVGKFYPEGTYSRKMLPYYAGKFNTVEVNATFYRFPTKMMVRSFVERTPPSFLFSIKANRLITHFRRLADVAVPFKRFYSLLSPLREKGKLGSILFQLPESFTADVPLLSDFLEVLPSGEFDITFEFRHKSWGQPAVLSLLKEKNADFAAISAPDITPFTTAIASHKYFRFHGETRMYQYDYSEDELKGWARIIRRLGKKAGRVYCYFNNDPEACAPKNAAFLCKLLKVEGK